MYILSHITGKNWRTLFLENDKAFRNIIFLFLVPRQAMEYKQKRALNWAPRLSIIFLPFYDIEKKVLLVAISNDPLHSSNVYH